MKNSAKMLRGIYAASCLAVVVYAGSAQALPIGFGTPPGDLSYDELKSKNFYIYHDARTPREAAMTLNALEAARPVVENWFDIHRSSPLPVIMSATTANASFANFITDALELQTMGQGDRDLAWHEYVHSTMYRHFDNWLGPAGSILHLLWLPSWFVEGLAEALSVSIGSSQQAGIERYHALTGDFPSYNKLHSLYANADFSFRGYATSGAFVAYLLRLGNDKNFPKLLNDYFYRSMVWWWPWSAVPFVDSMPLDQSLKSYAGAGGEQMYAQYREAAAAYWEKNAPGELYVLHKKSHTDFPDAFSLQARGNKLYTLRYHHNRVYEAEVKFKNNWGDWTKDLEELPEEATGKARIYNSNLKLYALPDKTLKGRKGYILNVASTKSHHLIPVLTRPGYLGEIYETANHIAWTEREEEQSRFCFVDRRYIDKKKKVPPKAVACPYPFQGPTSISSLGAKFAEPSPGNFQATQIWLKITEQTLAGNRHKVMIWNAAQKNSSLLKLKEGGEPVSAAFTGEQNWLLMSERNHHSLRKVDLAGNCLSTIKFSDLPSAAYGLSDGSLIMPVFAGDKTALLKLRKEDQKEYACYQADEHTSPLLYAVQNPSTNDLSQSLAQASLWKTPNAEQISEQRTERDNAKPLDQDVNAATKVDDTSTPAHWRPRPVFAVPWLGADALGTQFGILSVPLMDHMQNETLRAYVAYGLESRYPDTELVFTSTRFWPAWEFDAFRYQTWNGTYRNKKTDLVDYAFFDERGVRLTMDLPLFSLDAHLRLGSKTSKLTPYIGTEHDRQGILTEPFAEVSHSTTVGAYTVASNITTEVAPDGLNEEFDYNKVSAATGISREFDFLDSTFSLGVDGGRTRGTKRRELQEVYRPLKIFVPGSGGGFNNINIPIAGNGGLFAARYGDNQFRTNASYTFPLIKDIDKLVRLFYLDRLDFTAFFNYGGAWYGDLMPSAYDLIAAHGYNVDLQFDIKGINFNLGQGIGQVFGSELETYFTFGFDAIL